MRVRQMPLGSSESVLDTKRAMQGSQFSLGIKYYSITGPTRKVEHGSLRTPCPLLNQRFGVEAQSRIFEEIWLFPCMGKSRQTCPAAISSATVEVRKATESGEQDCSCHSRARNLIWS